MVLVGSIALGHAENKRVFDGGDDLQSAATVRAMLDVDVKNPIRPRTAMRACIGMTRHRGTFRVYSQHAQVEPAPGLIADARNGFPVTTPTALQRSRQTLCAPVAVRERSVLHVTKFEAVPYEFR